MSGTEDKDNDIEIEVVDDTPPQDRGRPRRAEGEKPYDPSDDEIANYSEDVQKRIKRLRFEFHEERRGKESAERERIAAEEFARKVFQENQRLQKMVEEREALAVKAAQDRVKAELVQAEREAREAYESGDPAKVVEANRRIANLTMDERQVSNWQPPRRQEPQVQVQAPAPRVPEPDPMAVDWARDNEWFGKDKRMTAFAYGVHEELVQDRRIDPRSREYYRALDEEMRKMFPDRFEDTAEREVAVTSQRRAPPTVVAPATRSVRAPRKVQLTTSQQTIARRLGLTDQQYAEQVVKEMQNG